MILDELVVHNFGLYSERQKIVLTPPAPDRSIILFGGLNGHGKTTLLDALQLCLYGPFAKISTRNNLSYQNYLSSCFHRGSRTTPEEAAVEVAFRHIVDGKENLYRIHRSWRMRKNRCAEHFEVLKNHSRDYTLAENWISHIEDIIPANICSLFLFNGEQVEKYFAEKNSTQLIGTAIRNLLGLDIVDQLEQDMLTYSRRKRAENGDDPKHHEIEKAEARLKELRMRISRLKEEQSALKTTGIDRAREDLLAAEDKYQRLGGELYDHRIEIERKLEAAERTLEESKRYLRELAAGDLPLILVRDLLKTMQVQDQKEEESRRSQDVATVLENRDEELVRRMHLHGVDSRIIGKLSAHLELDRSRLRSLGERKTVLDLLPEVRSDLHVLLRNQLDRVVRDADLKRKNNEKAKDRVKHTRLEYSSIPSSDAVLEIIGLRENLIKEIGSLEKRYAEMGDELDQLERKAKHSEQVLARLIESDIQAEGKRQDRARILHHAGRVRATFKVFRDAVIARNVDRIGQLVLESYQQLLRKTSLVTRLKIDSETFALTLYGHDGRAMRTERLSAGERQLLAVALLWGLAKASGRALPTAIDTPLGRLDAEHRKLLTERYFPFVSHQTLLLSTDEEITGSCLEELRPFIGRSYHLSYDDETVSTRIVEGYFDETEAT